MNYSNSGIKKDGAAEATTVTYKYNQIIPPFTVEVKKGCFYMAREKPYFREVVAEIAEKTGKTILGVRDVMEYLHVGHNKAVQYLDGNKTITVFQLASKLL